MLHHEYGHFLHAVRVGEKTFGQLATWPDQLDNTQREYVREKLGRRAGANPREMVAEMFEKAWGGHVFTDPTLLKLYREFDGPPLLNQSPGD